jgi:hypothetical protein
MKLTFRGNSYEVPVPIQLTSDSTERTKIKLIYRGNTFYCTPRPVVISDVKTDGPTVTLIYRGNTYKRKLGAPKSHQKPRAINWRWQGAE